MWKQRVRKITIPMSSVSVTVHVPTLPVSTKRVFVDTVRPHETDLEQFDDCGSIGAVRME